MPILNPTPENDHPRKKCTGCQNKTPPVNIPLVVDTSQIHATEDHVPERATTGAAGYDLKSVEEYYLQPGETKLIKTSFCWCIPEGYVGMVCSRSGLALKHSVFVLNAPGIVDSDYQGNVGIILHNASSGAFVIKPDDRIAQMVIVKSFPAVFTVVEQFNENSLRGSGGFGSTGV